MLTLYFKMTNFCNPNQISDFYDSEGPLWGGPYGLWHRMFW